MRCFVFQHLDLWKSWEGAGTYGFGRTWGLSPVFPRIWNVVVMQIWVCWWQRKTAPSCFNSNWAKNLSQIKFEGSTSKTVPQIVEVYIMIAISVQIASLFLSQPAMSLIHGPIAQSITQTKLANIWENPRFFKVFKCTLCFNVSR